MTRKNQVDDLLTRFGRKTINQEKCPYCQGVKRIRDDLVHYTFRHILQIQNGDELWSIVITNNHEYKTMAYIEYCPKCGRKL